MGTGTVAAPVSEIGLEFQQLRDGIAKLERAKQKLEEQKKTVESDLVRSLAKEMGPEADAERAFSRHKEWKSKDDGVEERLRALADLSKKFESREKFLTEHHAAEVVQFVERLLHEKQEAASKQEQVSEALQQEIAALEELLDSLRGKKGRKAKTGE